MNLIFKVSFNNYSAWRKEFDAHKEQSTVCDESKTTVGKMIQVAWSCYTMST